MNSVGYCQNIDISLQKLQIKHSAEWGNLNYDTSSSSFCLYKTVPDVDNIPTICAFITNAKNKEPIQKYIKSKQNDLKDFKIELISRKDTIINQQNVVVLLWEFDDVVIINDQMQRFQSLEYIISDLNFIYSIIYTNDKRNFLKSILSGKKVLNSAVLNNE